MANALILSPLPIVAATASSTARGTAMNVANDFAGVVWRSAPVEQGNASLLIDLGEDLPVDTLMLFGVDGDYVHDAGLAAALATKAQGPSFSGGNTATGVGAGDYFAVGNTALLAGGRRGSAGRGISLATWSTGPSAIRYISLYIYGLTPAGSVQVARVCVGKRFVPERNFRFGAGFGVRDLGKVDFSRFGVPLRTRGAKLRTTSLTFSALKRDEVEASTRPLLERHGNTEFLALVTDPAIVPDLPNRCYFGPIVGDNPGHVWRNAAGWETTLNLVSAF